MSPPLGTPLSVEQAVARLRQSSIPTPVLEVARTLQAAGHAAVMVGGSVRDTLLGRQHGDWDLASSATPTEVQAAFRRTIPTGIEHGTITVMVGRGDQREGVEVTTFRGEGAYVDGRRPTEVHFLRELEDDLARRDFTINALAWDPIREQFTDAFDGLADLNAGRIRAVGVALDRFLEDGLRVMRAVRFAATLGFALEAETEAAIEGALEVFDKVSRERVQVELFKLLGAAQPSRGLAPMARRGLWPRVLLPIDGELEALIASCDARPPRVEVRLAHLLRAASPEAAQLEAVLDGLKPSRALRADIMHLVAPELERLVEPTTPEPELRRIVARLGRERLPDALDMLAADEAARTRVQAAVADKAIVAKELALAGRDLIAEGVCKPGPQIGEILAALLEAVLEAPELNDRQALLARARAEKDDQR